MAWYIGYARENKNQYLHKLQTDQVQHSVNITYFEHAIQQSTKLKPAKKASNPHKSENE